MQVGLYFYNKLYRGNRVTKVDTSSFNAFTSPNLAPLAICEVDITSTASFQGSRHLLLTSPQAFHYFDVFFIVSQLGYRLEGEHHVQVPRQYGAEQERRPAAAVPRNHFCYRKSRRLSYCEEIVADLF